jgi:hypothetical protein
MTFLSERMDKSLKKQLDWHWKTNMMAVHMRGLPLELLPEAQNVRNMEKELCALCSLIQP